MTQFRRLRDGVTQVLLADWDPIDIRDVPQARDEYDQYVVPVEKMLIAGTSVSDIARYLLQIEINTMGLRGNTDRAHSVAEKLRALILSSRGVT